MTVTSANYETEKEVLKDYELAKNLHIDLRIVVKKLKVDMGPHQPCKISPLAEQGFVARMMRAIVAHKKGPLSLVIKMDPKTNASEHLKNLMLRERFFFSNVLPQLEKGIPNLPIVEVYRITKTSGAIIMQDLSAKGFKTICLHSTGIRKKVLTLPIANMAVEGLAKLHAASVINNEKWDCNPIPYDAEKFSEEFRKHCIELSVQQIILPLMKSLLEHREFVVYKRFMTSKDFLLKFNQFNESVDDPAGPGRYNVLLHSDCHMMNMMFKLDSKGGKPKDMRFIDFQAYHFGPAYIDLLYFIYTSATQEFRKENEKEIIQHYVESFNAQLKDSDKRRIDFEDFWASYNKARYYGVVVAIGFRYFQLWPPAKGNIDWLSNFDTISKDEIVQREVTDLIEHAIEVYRDFLPRSYGCLDVRHIGSSISSF